MPTVTKLALHRETVMNLAGGQFGEQRGVPAAKDTVNQWCKYTRQGNCTGRTCSCPTACITCRCAGGG
jgi:hypothetical protein